MREFGKPQSEVQPENNWVNIRDILPVGFWFGSDYKGNYVQRLQLDLPAIEQICRIADLPPIILKSDIWNPPATHTPEVAAPGLSILKKVSLQKDLNLPEVDHEYYHLSVTDERMIYKAWNIPVGWIIKLKDRKLLHNYQYSHPQATSAQTEEYFVTEIHKALSSALTDIALREVFGFRQLDKNDRFKHLGWRTFRQFFSAIPGGLMNHETTWSFIWKTLAVNSAMQSWFKGTETSVDYAMRIIDKASGGPFNHWPDGNHRKATYLWRLINFPDQAEQVYRHIEIAKRLGVAVIPGGDLLEDLYLTKYALAKHKLPLIRLAQNGNNNFGV